MNTVDDRIINKIMNFWVKVWVSLRMVNFELVYFIILLSIYFSFAIYSATIITPPRFDEAYNLLMIRYSSSISYLIKAIQQGVDTTLLYSVLLKIIISLIGGINDLILGRMFSLIMMFIGVLFLFFLLRKGFDKRTAIFGVSIFIASGFVNFVLFDVRQYALTLALGSAAFFFYLSGKPNDRWVSAILFFFGLFAHLFSIFIFIACGMTSLVILVEPWPLHKRLVTFGQEVFPIILAFLLFIATWYHQIGNTASDYSISSDFLSLGDLSSYLVGWPWLPKIGINGSIIITTIFFICIFIWILFQIKTLPEKQLVLDILKLSRGRILVAAAFLAISTPFIWWLLPSLFNLRLFDRYFLFQSLGINILLAVALGFVLPKFLKIKWLLSFSSIVIISLYFVQASYPLILGVGTRINDAKVFHNQTIEIEKYIKNGENVIFDFQNWDERFFLYQAWNSEIIANQAIMQVPDGWNKVPLVYRKFYSVPTITTISESTRNESGDLLISSDSDKSLSERYPKYSFVLIDNLGESLGGYQMFSYRLLNKTGN